MRNTFIDFHTHTVLSDGICTPMELCSKAQAAGIGILSITDHNHTPDLSALRKAYPNLTLIQGAEISCLYNDAAGEATELHVIALGFDPDHPKLKDVLARNQVDRRPYINEILNRLRCCGIDLGSYETLKQLYPDRGHLGRMDIAKLLTDRGYTASIAQAFDEYLGKQGSAYVCSNFSYVPLEDAVAAILAAGGVAVLAHLYYYRFDDARNEALLHYFKQLTGERGAMEVYYSLYDSDQRTRLKALADRFGLMHSAASDFHGQGDDLSLDNQFSAGDCAPLISLLTS